MPFSPADAARWIADAHARREPYANLPEALAPPSVADAYAAQEALHALWTPAEGPIAGLKIATTTKVMQQLMGIDHPCGGAIFANRIHASPATLSRSRYVNLVIECELAVRLGADLAKAATPWTRERARAAVEAVMPAFELIEDRNAVYRATKALSLIADNAWNGGIVLGAERTPPAGLLDGIGGRVRVDGRETGSGRTDDPMGALAWVANLAADRGRPLRKGMVVITGSVIATFPVKAGDTVVFELDGLGETRASITA
jgi:2-keto-4-pentenoate hydratase